MYVIIKTVLISLSAYYADNAYSRLFQQPIPIMRPIMRPITYCYALYCIFPFL